MAKKRGSTGKTPATEKAVALLFDSFGELYALDDIARNLGESPLTVLTNIEITKALCAPLVVRMNECEKLLGIGHRAANETETASQTLAALVQFVDALYDGGNGYLLPPHSAGVAMRAFVIQTGRAIERAEIALDANGGSAGYLSDAFYDTEPTTASKQSREACHG